VRTWSAGRCRAVCLSRPTGTNKQAIIARCVIGNDEAGPSVERQRPCTGREHKACVAALIGGGDDRRQGSEPMPRLRKSSRTNMLETSPGVLGEASVGTRIRTPCRSARHRGGEPDRVAIAASQAAMRGSKSGSSPAPAFRSERSDAIAPMSPVAATRTTTSGSSEAMAHRCSRPARRCPGDRQGAPSYGASFGWHQRAALAPAPRLASGCFLGALSGRAASNVELAATLRRGHARCSPAPVGSVHASQS
jgi:hypothetical protein